jgi:hypothetical protein
MPVKSERKANQIKKTFPSPYQKTICRFYNSYLINGIFILLKIKT